MRAARLVAVLAAALAAAAAALAEDAAAAPPLVYPEGEPRAGEPIMPVIQAAVDDPAVVEAAAWAVGHLRALSDSGVYASLSLAAVSDAATQEGVFHNNTLLTLELASPHFLGGAPTSTHKVIVMADLEDGVRSFAIDEFPVMDPDAIEEFWIRKVEAHRAARQVELAALEAEYAAHEGEICAEEALRRRLAAEMTAGSGGGAGVTDAPLAEVAVDAAGAQAPHR